MSKHIPDTIKAVLFDHDDTLVGTKEAKWAQHKHIAKTHYNKELSDDEIRKVWGIPFSQLVCVLYGTEDVDQAMSHVRANRGNFEKVLYEATVPLLKQLKLAGMLVGLITASSSDSFSHDLEYHEIPRQLFDHIQTADDTDFHKPDPRVFEPTLEWLQSLGVSPDEVLYVGDGLHDMKAALGARFNFLGVQTGLVTADEFRAAGATSISGIDQLLSS